MKDMFLRDNMICYAKVVSCNCKEFCINTFCCLHVIEEWVTYGYQLQSSAANSAPNRRPGCMKKINCMSREIIQDATYFTNNPSKAAGIKIEKNWNLDGRLVKHFGTVTGVEFRSGHPWFLIQYFDTTKESVDVNKLMKILIPY